MSDAAGRLARIQARIAAAARIADRQPSDVRLIAVSKSRSGAEIEALITAGQKDFGENRVQEAAAKWPDLRAQHPDLRLHMIGQLQSNKATEAATLFDEIHTLDRPSLLAALVKAKWSGPTFVQVNIGDEEQKGGIRLTELGELLTLVRAAPLSLAGLTGIPPAGLEAAPYFALLAKLARRHDVTDLSMGMSGDFETAIHQGATTVRIGTALFED